MMMPMKRAYYSDSIADFIQRDSAFIIGTLTQNSEFSVDTPQRDAWSTQIVLLKAVLSKYQGFIYFEYSIPRMGERIDVILLIGPVIYVLEFKIGEKEFLAHAVDQVCDYALDLKNFHETSHERHIVPVLIASKAKAIEWIVGATPQNDRSFP
jgi:hypothetical protein